MPNYFTGSITRDPSEKSGESPSVLDFGAKADGVILSDGAITNGDKTFTSATADFTTGVGNPGDIGYRPTDVGKSIWIEGAGGASVDLLTTIASVTGPGEVETTVAASATVSAANARYGTDNAAAIQAAFDISSTGHGKRIYFPSGCYLTASSITLTHNLTAEGAGYSYHVWGTGSPSLIACCANVPVFQYTDTGGDGWQSGVIKGLTFRGTSRSGSKGIYTARAAGAQIEDCTFYWFGDQAIHMIGGIFDIHLFNCHATDCLMVRTGRTDYVGVFDLEPSDLIVESCLASMSTPDNAGGEYGTGYCAAFCIRGGNSWLSNNMGHHSEIGYYIGAASASITTLVNCRADRNQGHGFVVACSGSNFIGCRSCANGLDADETYDGFLISGAGNSFHACQVYNYAHGGVGAIYNIYAYGFETTNADSTEANHFFGNYCLPAYVAGSAYHFTGTQTLQVIDYSTNLEHATRRLRVIHGGLKLHAQDQSDGMIMMKTDDANAGADEKIWTLHHNYSATYKELMLSLWDDAFTAETPFLVVNRTGTTVNLIKLYNASTIFLDGHVKVGHYLEMYDPAADADERIWTQRVNVSNPNEMLWGAWNDAMDTEGIWLRVARTGAVPTFVDVVTGVFRAFDDIILQTAGKHLRFVGLGAIQAGTGTPEAAITDTPGSLYLDGEGKLWVKATGVGNTGWVQALTGAAGVLTVPDGGTGAATLTAHGVLVGEGTDAITATVAGNAGEVLTSNGAAADPTFQAAPGPGQVLSQSHTGTVVLEHHVTDAAADEKNWEIRSQAGVGYSQMVFSAIGDASGYSTWLGVNRTGVTVTQVTITATAIQLTGTVALGTPLAAGSGGTGANTLTQNGVLMGNGTGAVSAINSTTTTHALFATAGAPAFRAIAQADVPAMSTDRGDPSAPDLTEATVTIDSAYHDWDLSAIVPAGATTITIRALMANSGAAGVIILRKNGNSNAVNVAQIRTYAAGQQAVADLTVACDANRVIEYYILNAGTYVDIDLTVAGWSK